MNAASGELEREICRIYEQQVEKYEVVLQVSDRLAEQYAADLDTCESLERIGLLLDEIARLDQSAQESRKRWTALQRKPGEPLKRVLDRLQHLIGNLIERISGAEAVAQQTRQRLLPQLGREALGQQMQQAYQATVRAGSA